MLDVGPYRIKFAATAAEIDQVHALNCETFAGEIPQHEAPANRRLVDKFHDKNSYIIALRDERVVGMVSFHDQAPFSVASRMTDPMILARPNTRPLEVRLLAVTRDERSSPVFACLAWAVWKYAHDTGYSHLFISGFVDRLELYERIGFERIGPPVGPPDAAFVPMCLELAAPKIDAARRIRRWERRLLRG